MGYWKGVRTKTKGTVELYDLQADIGEKNNVGDHPAKSNASKAS
jgi:hypothetical protein